MTILVLRPERAARRTVEGLTALGFEAVVGPVLVIQDLDATIPLDDFDCVLATSANGLRKLAARPEMARFERSPLIAVGDRTAHAGREAGFETVHVAEGDGRALVSEALARFRTPSRFLHAAGADRAFDIAGALALHGHAVAVVELYRAAAVDRLPEPAEAALRGELVEAVLHHSRRIAETFLALADAAGLGREIRRLPHVALARRVAVPLEEAGCSHVAVAERPDEASLFDTLQSLMRDVSPSGPRRIS